MTYYPGPAPTDPKLLAGYVRAELEKVARELQQPAQLPLKVLHTEPDRPREGVVVCADGAEWDPGSGGGFYGYFGGAWTFLG